MGRHHRGKAALAACLALALLGGCRPGGSARSARYHVLRFWGVKAKPPPEVIDRAIDSAARRHGVPADLFRRLVRAESAGDPDAVSHKGARGLAQIMPANARRCGLPDAAHLDDPLKNAACGAQILREEIATYRGDLAKALRAYNGGPKCVRGRCAESEAYVRKILG